MSTEYPSPSPVEELKPTPPEGNNTEAGASIPGAVVEKASGTEVTEPSADASGSSGCPEVVHPVQEQSPEKASLPTGPQPPEEASPPQTAQETSRQSEGKKRRILIGSQRDPSLFSQYKPKPALAVPARGELSARQRRTRKPKRPGRPLPTGSPGQDSSREEAAGFRSGEAPVPSGEPELGPAVSTPPVSQTDQPAERSASSAVGTAPSSVGESAAANLVGEGAAGRLVGEGAAGTFVGERPAAKPAETAPTIPSAVPSPIAPMPAMPTGLAGPAEFSGRSELAGSAGLAGPAAGVPSSAGILPAEPTAPSILTPDVPSSGEAWKEAELREPPAQLEPAEEEPPTPPRPSAPMGIPAKQKYPVPNLRAQLPEDLAAELQEVLADAPVEELLVESAASAQAGLLEPESRHQARIVRMHRDEVFVELGGREQGVVPLKQFAQPPEVGQQIEVIVTRFVPEEGLYELTLPASAALVAEWAQLAEGMLVEARVTAHNSGGLECEVGHIRAFIPISMVDLYRVTDPSEYVGQKFLCKVIECNPQRGNLVLSRRAVLEQQRQEARQQLLSSLAPGQIREGVVRKLMPFGAFVDLGHGVDGLVPISLISWRRINHPGEVLQVGQPVRVVVEKVDPDSGRISLSLRQLEEDPWLRVSEKYPPNTMVRGIVRRVVDFGAFVEVEPGVEGLVHISELSHKKVWRTRDVVQEGQEVEVVVLAVDPAQRRMSLSIRQALPPLPPPGGEQPAPEQTPATSQTSSAETTESTSAQTTSRQPPPGEPAATEPVRPESAATEPTPPAKKPKEKKPLKLKGGLGPSPRRGKPFGLKW